MMKSTYNPTINPPRNIDRHWEEETQLWIIEDMAPWGDGLLDIIPEKLNFHLEEMDKLTEEYEKMRVIITQEFTNGNLDEFSLSFWVLWIECGLAPYNTHQKWINYWLDLYDKIPAEKPKFERTAKYKDNKADIEKIRETPIADFYNDQLRKSANRLLGKCPFHEERTPSFFIFEDNHFHCFSCGEHGDVIAFVMKLKNINFKEAIELLK